MREKQERIKKNMWRKKERKKERKKNLRKEKKWYEDENERLKKMRRER